MPDVCIAVKFDFPARTGTPLYARQVARGIRDRGWGVTIVRLAPGWFGPDREETVDGIQVRHISRLRWRSGLRRHLATYRSDLVDVQHVGALMDAFPVGRSLGIPILYTHHCPWWEENRYVNYLRWRWRARRWERLEREYEASCAAVTVLSESMRDWIAERGTPRERIHVVYPGVEHCGTPPPRREGSVTVLYSGNMAPWQGVGDLAHAVPKVLAADPSIRFRIHTSDAAGFDRLFGGVGLAGRVERIPFRDDEPVLSSFESADILVLPRPVTAMNRMTSFKTMVYLGAARPIVATAAADNRTILERPGAALVVPDTPGGLAEGILTLARDPALRRRMGEAALALARERFSTERQAEAVEAAYRSAIR